MTCPKNMAFKIETKSPNQMEYMFEYHSFFGEKKLEAGDVLELKFAIVPVEPGNTRIDLDTRGVAAFLSFSFEGGLVNGAVPYNPGDWNDIEAVVDISGKSYTIESNGSKSGPFPLGCPADTVQALRLCAKSGAEPSEGWIDTVSLARIMPDGERELLLEENFEITGSAPPSDAQMPSGCKI